MKLLLTIFLAFAVAVSASAKSPKMVCDTTEVIPIFGGSYPWGGGPRSLSVSELRACVVSFGDNVYVVVTVLQDLGQMEYSITNTSTGWYIDDEFNAVPGSYPIPISGSPGFYTISFILPDGRSCNGTFEL